MSSVTVLNRRRSEATGVPLIHPTQFEGPKITLVTLGVEDLNDSIHFYRDGLGFPMQDRESDSSGAFFDLKGTWISLYPRDLLAEDTTGSDDELGFSGITLVHNVSSKDEVDANLAEAAGGQIVKPAQDVFGMVFGVLCRP